jgi:basic membrane protein A
MGFYDLDRNEELGRQMFADGADSSSRRGPAGIGVVSAAAALSGSVGRHLWAIGVDTDWYEDLSHNVGIISPGAWRSHVLTSVRKRTTSPPTKPCRAWRPATRFPLVKAYDLRSRFVDISYSGGFLDEVRPLIEDQRRRIVSSQLRVPCLPSDHVDVVRAHLEGTGASLDDWLEQGCPPWRISTGLAFDHARSSGSSSAGLG